MHACEHLKENLTLYVYGELDPATDIPVGEALSRYPVHGIVRGDMGQKGVVEDIPADIPDLCDGEQRHGAENITRSGECKERGEHRTGITEDEHEPLLSR